MQEVKDKITHKLMVKTHLLTGLKYLCYTTKDGEEYDRYPGSGTYWHKHLKEHGKYISTDLIFETDDHIEFKDFALNKSEELNIVISDEWANLIPEDGNLGYAFKTMKWITNGDINKLHLKSEILPIGWRFGLSNTHFNDSAKQSELAKRVNPENISKSKKQQWADGVYDKRDHMKCGVDRNDPVKRAEVSSKISKTLLKQSDELAARMKLTRANPKNNNIKCPYCDKTGYKAGMVRWHFDNCKHKSS